MNSRVRLAAVLFLSLSSVTYGAAVPAPERGRERILEARTVRGEGLLPRAFAGLLARLNLARKPDAGLKCSAAIDPLGAPCAMPSPGCRCIP